jgi:hypothetical protein
MGVNILCVGRGFLLMILWCSQSGDYSENNLAKFGYIIDMKVEFLRNRIFLFSWLPSGSYQKTLVIQEKN